MERIKEIAQECSDIFIENVWTQEDKQLIRGHIEYLLAENKRLREERDSANRVSVASLEQVLASGTELLMQEEVARNIAKFERIKEEHKRYRRALEKIGVTFTTDVDIIKKYHNEYMQWKEAQEFDASYVDWYHHLATTALKQE